LYQLDRILTCSDRSRRIRHFLSAGNGRGGRGGGDDELGLLLVRFDHFYGHRGLGCGGASNGQIWHCRLGKKDRLRRILKNAGFIYA